MFKSTLKLFNAIQIEENNIKNYAMVKSFLPYGIFIDPKISIPSNREAEIIEFLRLSHRKLNSSFHKSWDIIKNSPIEQLVIEQMIHYVTTYGFESLGIYNENSVYLPKEVLKVVNIDLSKIKFLYVKGLTKEEILDEIIKLSCFALAPETLDDIMTIIKNNNYDPAFLYKIQNRELKMLLYDYYKIYPVDPLEFLRLMIIKLTGESLIIKNDELIQRIKMADKNELDSLIKCAPDNFAEIFFRFKPLFLAMKKISNNKTFFNKLRKKANKLHKPQPIDYLNSVTDLLNKGEFSYNKFNEKLENASVFRKIRLLYSLNYRIDPLTDSIVYKIRNGKSWATDLKTDNIKYEDLWLAKKMCYFSIVDDLKKFNKGEKVYIPKNVSYALPATEKSFIGNIPEKSYVVIPNDIILGIHWYNHSDRTDFDLSLINKNRKLGWDGAYRNNKILFSGDMTDAPKPNGASEMFYVSESNKEPYTLSVNDYTYDNDEIKEFRFFIANEKAKNLDKNYMVDPNNILIETHVKIKDPQLTLGLLIKKDGENRFCFFNFSSGKSITSFNNEVSQHVNNYLIGNANNFIGLRKMLEFAGIESVDDPKEATIDLSIENIDKNSILNLFK